MNNKHIKKFVNGEITRLSESVNETMGKKLKDEYGKISFEDFSKLRAIQAAIVACLTLAKKFNIFDGAFDVSNKQRKRFDIVEGIGRGLVNRFSKGKLFTRVLIELGLGKENIMKNIVTSLGSSLKLLSLGKQSFEHADKFLDAYSKAEEIRKGNSSGALDEDSEDIKAMIYTLHKAFPEQEEFDSFISNYELFVKQLFGIIIEDTIKMYINLSEDDFTVIIDSFTFTGSRQDSANNRDAVELALELQGKFRKSYEDNDGFTKLLVTFLRQVVIAYSEDFKDEYESIRKELYTKAEQERFIELYESGRIFGHMG